MWPMRVTLCKRLPWIAILEKYMYASFSKRVEDVENHNEM